MRESTTYMSILEEGREQGREAEAKRVLLLLGQDRFGPVDEATRAQINAITDIDRLEALTRRVLKVASWPELLQSA